MKDRAKETNKNKNGKREGSGGRRAQTNHPEMICPEEPLSDQEDSQNKGRTMARRHSQRNKNFPFQLKGSHLIYSAQ